MRCLRWALQVCCALFNCRWRRQAPPRLGFTFPKGLPQSLKPACATAYYLSPDPAVIDNFAKNSPPPPQTAVAIRAVVKAQQSKPLPSPIICRHSISVSWICYAPICHRRSRILSAADSCPPECRQELLEVELRITNDAIEQAYVDGLSDDGQRAESANQVEAVRIDKTLHVAELHRVLEAIRNRLRSERKRHLEHQAERWQKVQNRVQQSGLPQQDAALYEDILIFMNNLLARQDVIVVDERLARLEEILDQGQMPRPEEFVVVANTTSTASLRSYCVTGRRGRGAATSESDTPATQARGIAHAAAAKQVAQATRHRGHSSI